MQNATSVSDISHRRAVSAGRARQVRMVEWRQDWLLRGLHHLRGATVRVGRVYAERESVGSVDLAGRGDRWCWKLDARRIHSASLRVSSNTPDRRCPPRPSCDTACLRQHPDVAKLADPRRTILPANLAPVYAQYRVRSDQWAHHRFSLVRDCAPCHPSSPSAPTGNRPEGNVASTSASSFRLWIRQFRCDDASLGLRVRYQHLIRGASEEYCRITTRADRLRRPYRCRWRRYGGSRAVSQDPSGATHPEPPALMCSRVIHGSSLRLRALNGLCQT